MDQQQLSNKKKSSDKNQQQQRRKSKDRKTSTATSSRYLISFAQYESKHRFLSSLFKKDEQISTSLAALLDAAAMGIAVLPAANLSFHLMHRVRCV